MASRRLSLIFSTLWLHAMKTSFLVAANDACEDAVIVSSLPFAVDGNTSTATVDFETPTDAFRNLTCGISTESRGVWYQLLDLPASTFVKATVSPSATPATKFNVALFQGNTCDEMDCLRDFALQNLRTQPTLTWFADMDESYYLHVTGINANETGPFALQIEEVALDRPANDQCVQPLAPILNATSMEMEMGDTNGAWPHGIENEACSMNPGSRGLFYQVAGTGETLDVTLVISELPDEQRLELAVFESACSGAGSTCVAVSDFISADDGSETISFKTQQGVIYFVAVTGEQFEDAGKFGISVSKSEVQEGSSAANKNNGVSSIVGLAVGAVTTIAFSLLL